MKDSRPIWNVHVDDPAHDGYYLEQFRAGSAREAAEKFGRWWDVHALEFDLAGRGNSLDVIVWAPGRAVESRAFIITGRAVPEYTAQEKAAGPERNTK